MSFKHYGEFRFWCNKVLPLVYDDSLSYMELLCKVVDYVNGLIGDVNYLHNEFVELKEYVETYFDDVNLQNEVNNKLDEMAADGTLDALLSKYIYSSSFLAERMFRVIYDYDEYAAQCACWTGNSYVFGGANSDNSVAMLCEVGATGIVMRTATFSSSSMAHGNGIAYLDGKLYIASGSDNVITVVDYATFAIENTITVSDYYRVYGVNAYEGKLYILGYKTSGAASVISVSVLNDGTFEDVCTFSEPAAYAYGGMTKQNFCIYDGTLLVTYSKANVIYRISMEGEYLSTIYVGYGNGSFPYGEIQNLAVVNGQVVMFCSITIGTTDRTKMFAQAFMTNLGGKVSITARNGGSSLPVNNTLYVDPEDSQTNPTGTSDSPFNSLEEAMICYNYISQFAPTGVYQITCVNPVNNECCSINSGSVAIDFNNSELKRVVIYGGNVTLGRFSCEGVVYAYNSRLFIYSSTVGTLQSSYSDIRLLRTEVTDAYTLYYCEVKIDYPYPYTGWNETGGTFSRCKLYLPCVVPANDDEVNTTDSATVGMGKIMQDYIKGATDAGHARIEFFVKSETNDLGLYALRLNAADLTAIREESSCNRDIEILAYNYTTEKLCAYKCNFAFDGDDLVISMTSAIDVATGADVATGLKFYNFKFSIDI